MDLCPFWKDSCWKVCTNSDFLENNEHFRNMVNSENKRKTLRYFTSYHINTFTNQLPKPFFDFDLHIFKIYDFWKFPTQSRENTQNHSILVLSTLFGRNPLKMDTNIIDFFEIASSLRGHSSMMAQSFSMSRHAIITYSRRSRESRGLYSVKKSARNSKSLAKVSFKRVWPIPRCAPAYQYNHS